MICVITWHVVILFCQNAFKKCQEVEENFTEDRSKLQTHSILQNHCSSCHHLYQATVNPLPPFLTHFMRSSSAVLSHVLEGCAEMGKGTSHASGPHHCHEPVCNIAKLRNFTHSEWISFQILFFLSLPILIVTWPHFHDIGPGPESGWVRARVQPSDHSTKYEPLLQAPVQCSTVHHSTVLYACRLFYDNKKKINFLCHLSGVFIINDWLQKQWDDTVCCQKNTHG